MQNKSESQRKQMVESSLDLCEYKSEDGFVMKREYGESPLGVPVDGRWVLRDSEGEFVDMDGYRFDLCERHGFNIVGLRGSVEIHLT